MSSVMSAIQKTVPISQFNKGLAGKIFEEVKRTGAKVVMKNNTAECVLLSPEEYTQLIDEMNDAKLLAIALQRTKSNSKTISQEEFDAMFPIDESLLEGYEDVEFE